MNWYGNFSYQCFDFGEVKSEVDDDWGGGGPCRPGVWVVMGEQVNIQLPLKTHLWKKDVKQKFLFKIASITTMTSSNGNISALLALCARNSPVPVNSPHKGQWRGALMFSLICARINGWVNNGEAGDLRRHRARYDVIVMTPRDQWVNSLVPRKYRCNFKNAYLKPVLQIRIFRYSYDNALKWMPRDPTDDKPILVQVMAWCRQAASH